MNPMRNVPKDVLVTDNGGPENGGTYDRYTVVLPNLDCYSMSANGGVCMFHGNGCKPDPAERSRNQIPLGVAQKIEELL